MTSRCLAILISGACLFPFAAHTVEVTAGDSALGASANVPVPPVIPYAVVRLAPGLGNAGQIYPVTLTDSGRVLLTGGQGYTTTGNVLAGYRWHQGHLTALFTPAPEQDLLDAAQNPSGPYGPSLTINATQSSAGVAAMNESGAVIGNRLSSWTYSEGAAEYIFPVKRFAYHWAAESSLGTRLALYGTLSVGAQIGLDQGASALTDGGIIYGGFADNTGSPGTGASWADSGAAPQLFTDEPFTYLYGTTIRKTPSRNGVFIIETEFTYDFGDFGYSDTTLRVAGQTFIAPATGGDYFAPTRINNLGRFIGQQYGSARGVKWGDAQQTPLMLEPGGSAFGLNHLHGVAVRNAQGVPKLWRWVTDPITTQSAYEARSLWFGDDLIYEVTPTADLNIHEAMTGLQTRVRDAQGQSLPPAQRTSEPVLLIPAELVVDGNRDGILTPARENSDAALSDRTSKSKPFRFWSNDDDDVGPAAGDDIPGRALNKADYNNAVVDSVRDLVDFFPVYLDIKQLLTVLPPSASIKYKLKQADGALNFVYTNLTNQYLPAEKRSKAFDYQYKVLGTGFGPDFTQAAGVATTQQITAAGVELNTTFLDGIKNTDWGVLLIEGRVASDQPLKLVVEKDGTQLAEVALHIKISPVEEMFRHVNLSGTPKNYDNTNPILPETPEETRTGTPVNWPDTQTNGKYFVFLHGYNVDAQKARGWQAEVFKRMHALGSKARFVGVTWHGATGLDYHRAVFHAFQTGDALAGALSFTGNADVTIAAHSLGNMVVSHAMQAGGLSPARYYIINGATPLEAYGPNDAGPEEAANMTELAWRTYDSRLSMANWHTLFPSTDNRSALTWKGLFANVLPKAHNFYSEQEEVVADSDDNTSASVAATLLSQGFNVSLGAWKAQELVKGVDWTTSIVSAFMIRGQAGWGFNTAWDKLDDPTGPPGQGGTPIRRRLTPPQTVSITGEELKTKPFFEKFLELELMSANATTASNKAGEAWVRYDLFARGIPAMSNATAANFMLSLDDARNFPMHTAGKVAANGPFPTNARGDWRHSDFKDVGLPYVYPMYQAMIDRGGLNQ